MSDVEVLIDCSSHGLEAFHRRIMQYMEDLDPDYKSTTGPFVDPLEELHYDIDDAIDMLNCNEDGYLYWDEDCVLYRQKEYEDEDNTGE